MFDHKRPYNELPLLPPSQDIETPAILKACVPAAEALGRLREAVRGLPDPMILINTLHLQEARASSEIENIVTTNNDIFSALSSPASPMDKDTKEVINYKRALFLGVEKLKEKNLLTTNLLEKICTTITNNETNIRQTPKRSLKNQQTGEIIYTPPEGEERLRNLLSNLEKFIHNHQDILPLIKMAIIHYQFEAIHPFSDGNGRTGRILNILYLMQQELLDLPILYLSRYFLDHRTDYYFLLNAVTQENAWEPWIIYTLNAVQKTAENTLDMIYKIQKLKEEYHSMTQEDKTLHRLIDLIFELPYIRIKNVMDRLEITRVTATKYLRKLNYVSVGLLTKTSHGKTTLFINAPLIRLIKTDDLDRVVSDIKENKNKIDEILDEVAEQVRVKLSAREAKPRPNRS